VRRSGRPDRESLMPVYDFSNPASIAKYLISLQKDNRDGWFKRISRQKGSVFMEDVTIEMQRIKREMTA
jgi:hypothetical protein